MFVCVCVYIYTLYIYCIWTHIFIYIYTYINIVHKYVCVNIYLFLKKYFRFASPQSSLWYHSSAVLALALDALTVPYRLRNNSVPMWQLADTLAVSGRKVTSLGSKRENFQKKRDDADANCF